MSKEITEKAVTDLSTNLEDWGESEGGSEELIIPKLLLQQGLSERVVEDEAKIGDYVNTLTGEVLAGVDKPIDLVPFMFTRRFVISEKKAGSSRFTFKRFDVLTKANEKAAWFFEEGGLEMKREYLREFYCINPADPSLPIIINFKSTSAQVGKQIWMQMYVLNKQMGKVPPAFKITIGSKKEKKEDATFAVSTFKRGEAASEETIASCRSWLGTLRTQDIKVDDSEYDESSKPVNAEVESKF